jgi:cell division protein FtsB
MRVSRLVLALCLGFCLSTVLFLLFGTGGIGQYRELLAYRDSLQANIEDLSRIQQGLLQELEALGSDPERVTLQARQLGYFKEGERVIRIQGYEAARSGYTVGRILRRKPVGEPRDWVLRLTGLGLPVMLFALIALREGRENHASTHP